MAKKKTKSWRKAVQEAMRDAAEKEAKRRTGTANPSFDYRWEHITAVVTLAIKLAELTGADVEVAEAAAWLHDVRKEAGGDHPEEGAKFARKLLPKTDFPDKKIDAVAEAIEDHMGLWRNKPLKTLESQILWDADKLSKIGLTAAMHWMGGDFAKGKNMTTADIINNGRSIDWMGKTIKSMHTKPAKRAAKKRYKAYKKLWDKLEAELNGDDIK